MSKYGKIECSCDEMYEIFSQTSNLCTFSTSVLCYENSIHKDIVCMVLMMFCNYMLAVVNIVNLYLCQPLLYLFFIIYFGF